MMMKALILATLTLAAAGCAQNSDAPVDVVKLKADFDRATRTLQDWPALNRYRADNAKVAPPAAGEERVVFMGGFDHGFLGTAAREVFSRVSRTSIAGSAGRRHRRC